MHTFQNKDMRKQAYFLNTPPEMHTPAVMDILQKDNFFTCPSSASHHNAYEGGNFDHVHGVASLLEQWTKALNIQWQLPRSPTLIGYWHDLCKGSKYTLTKQPEDGEKPKYTYAKTLYTGHGEVSAVLADKLLHSNTDQAFMPADYKESNYCLTEEERACIWYHMGPYIGKEFWPSYDYAVKQYPNILWVHHADMVASKILESGD